MKRPTESNKRGDDGHGERSQEQVDQARKQGDLPHTGVPQPNHVSVGVMHLNVCLNPSMRRKRAANLEENITILYFPFS